MILTKDQKRSKRDKQGVRIEKSRYIELNRTCCCIEKFNVVLSLYRVLRINLYFSKGFLKAVTRGLVVAEAL